MNPQVNHSNFYADAFAQSNNSNLYTNSQQNRQILHVYTDTNHFSSQNFQMNQPNV